MPVSAQDETERSGFIQFVENQLSTPDRQIRLNGIQGTLSSNVRFESITLADREGIWLTIVEPQLIWSRSALLGGRLEIERLTATRIDVARPPAPVPNRPDMQATSFQVPELPVAVQIDALVAEQVSLAEGVLGPAVVFSVDGRLALEGGGLDARLALQRLDGGEGQVNLTAAFQPEEGQLAVDLRGSEARDGIMANLLDIPARPALDFAIVGAGPIDELSIDLQMAADGERLISGTLTTARQSSGTQLMVDADAQLVPLVSGRLANFFAGESLIEATALVGDDGSIDLSRFDLQTAQASIMATGMRDAQGAFVAADVDLVVRSGDGTPVILPFGADTSINALSAQIDYAMNRRQALKAIIDVDQMRAGETSIGAFDASLDGLLRRTTDTSQVLDFVLRGRAENIGLADPAVASLVAQGVDIEASGTWRENAPMRLEAANVLSDGWTLSADGQVDGAQFDGQLRAVVDRLSAFEPLLGFAADGAADVVMIGMIDALTGGFDLRLNGVSNVAPADDANALGKLLTGQTNLSGAVARDEQGTRFNRFQAENNQLDIGIDGVLAPSAADLKLDGQLNDLSDLTASASGALTLEGTVVGSGPAYETRLSLGVPNGTLSGQTIVGLGADFVGTLETAAVNGALMLDGRLAGEPLEGTLDLIVNGDRQELNNLDVRYAGAELSGGIATGNNGALAGAINFKISQLANLARLAGQDANGAASGSFTLSSTGNGAQNGTLVAQLSGLQAAGLRVRSGNLQTQIADLFDAQNLTSRITLNGVDISGAATINSVSASVSGPFERLVINTEIDGVSAPALTAAGVQPLGVNADLVVLPGSQAVQLTNATARNGQGLVARGTGSVAYGAGTLNIQLDGEAPLSLARGALSSRGTRVDGNANFSLVIGGRLEAPRTTGLVSITNASLVDPLSNLQVGNLDAVAGFEGDTISIRRLRGRVGEGGRFTGSGNIGLGAGLPANLEINLIGVPYTDGQTFATTLNGSLALGGSLIAAPQLSGTINLARTEIVVPEVLGAALDLPNVVHETPDAATQETLDRLERVNPSGTSDGGSSPLRLDLQVNAPAQIYIRGRGLDAELGGSIRLTGPLTNVSPVGRFDLRRGRLEILSQRLDFDTGSFVLVGDLDPILNLVANTQSDDVLATVTVTGRPSDLSIIFSSSPELPQDEVIARIVFGRSVSELSPVQILRLANAVSELSGQSTSLFGATRSLVGLDNLDLVDDGEGNAAVRAGTYINERVYFGVDVGQETEATINLDISESLTARGSVSDDA
ncbi:MAG: translocation/assembly module TamB domain-containing protein [Pseudomonadota bacterium]